MFVLGISQSPNESNYVWLMLLYNYPVPAFITECTNTNITVKRQEVGFLKICIQNHDYKQNEGMSRTEGQRGKTEEGEEGRQSISLMKQLQNANKLLPETAIQKC